MRSHIKTLLHLCREHVIQHTSNNIIGAEIGVWQGELSETLLNDPRALQSMHYLKKEAVIMKNALLKGDIDALCESMKRGWLHKQNTSDSISNSKITSLFNCAKNNHALAGKISGAGGGGYCWFIVLPENKMKLMRSLNDLGGTASSCHFVNKGCEAWTL